MSRTTIEGPFAPRLVEMLESPAWRVLSLSGRRIIDRLEIELCHHGGTDNGKLPVTYADFMRYGMHSHAIAPGIREAVALGFAEVTEKGRAGNREFRMPSTYRLTFRHTNHAKPTHEWRRIETVEEAETIAGKARAASPVRPAKAHPKKQKTAGGKRRVSPVETDSEKPEVPLAETDSPVPLSKTDSTLDIWDRGHTNEQRGDAQGPQPAQRIAPVRSQRIGRSPELESESGPDSESDEKKNGTADPLALAAEAAVLRRVDEDRRLRESVPHDPATIARLELRIRETLAAYRADRESTNAEDAYVEARRELDTAISALPRGEQRQARNRAAAVPHVPRPPSTTLQ